MAVMDIVRQAERDCIIYHGPQMRKSFDPVPYFEHPFAVRKLLVKHGYDDPVTQSMGLLHDILEDTDFNQQEFMDRYGREIYEGVGLLSRNMVDVRGETFIPMFETLRIPYTQAGLVTPLAYKIRILNSNDKVKKVKLADLIDNVSSIHWLEPGRRAIKIMDAETFYIPLGLATAPDLAQELAEKVDRYRTLFG